MRVRCTTGPGHPSDALKVKRKHISITEKTCFIVSIINFQDAIFDRDTPNDKGVPGLTEVLWQHPSSGWEVGRDMSGNRMCGCGG